MLDWLGELKEDERVVAIRNAFAKVASTQEGAVVFAVLFEHLYTFRPCPTPEATALSNYAKEKLLPYFGEDVDLRIMEAILENAHRITQTLSQGEENGD